MLRKNDTTPQRLLTRVIPARTFFRRVFLRVFEWHRRLEWSHFLLGLSFLSVLSVFGIVWIGYEFYRGEFPNVRVLRSHYPVVHYRGKGKEWDIRLDSARPRYWVNLGGISRMAVGAVLVSEDWAFFQHQGYDPHQIRQVVEDAWTRGRLKRGASTITQQVVKNVFLDRDRTLWRKLKELWLALQMEKAVGKKRILEVYLNIAEWGEGIFGIQQASLHYFKKPASQLTAKEGAFLAMLLPSPKRYSQSYYARRLTPYAAKTIRRILRKMEQAQYLSAEDRFANLVAPLPFELSRSGIADLPAPVAIEDDEAEPDTGAEESSLAEDDSEEADAREVEKLTPYVPAPATEDPSEDAEVAEDAEAAEGAEVASESADVVTPSESEQVEEVIEAETVEETPAAAEPEEVGKISPPGT